MEDLSKLEKNKNGASRPIQEEIEEIITNKGLAVLILVLSLVLLLLWTYGGYNIVHYGLSSKSGMQTGSE